MEKLKKDIVQKIAELGEVDGAEVRGERPLKELGIDSLMAIELVVFIEKLIKKPFPEERMGAILTCADVFREVENLLGSPAMG
jgi:acyl carrier protein